VKSRRLARGRRRHAMLWLQHRGRCWLQQRPARGVWGGLWCLPLFDRPAALSAHCAGWPGSGEALPPIEHALTHFDWTLEPLVWRLPSRTGAARLARIEASLGSGRWAGLDEALALGLPAPLRRLFESAPR
jgi:A/G-specific adenine glycosylase